MMESIGRIWSRDAVGYRRGEMDEGDGLAAIVVASIGGPALILGAALIQGGVLSLIQILLMAPVAAVVGGLLIGSSARMAASTGANGIWLLRPAFGLVGSWLLTLLRLIMVAAWAVLGLQMAGRWGAGALTAAGFGVGGPASVILVLAALAALALFLGPLFTIHYIVRRPLLWGSVALVAVAAWRLAPGGALSGEASGSFWSGAQTAIEMSAVFVPFTQAIARRLHDDGEAATTFGVGYTVPTTLMLVAGAIFAQRLSGLEDLTGLDVGTAGIALAIAWVVVAELDQAFSSFLATGSEASGVIGRLSPVLVGAVAVVAVGAAAVALPLVPLSWTLLLTSLVFPACLITVADFFLARDRHYSESEIYGAAAGDSLVNVVGVVTWLLTVILGHLLDPVGPERWMAMMPDVAVSADLPWRLLMAVVGGVAYVVLNRWRQRRRSAVYELRGV